MTGNINLECEYGSTMDTIEVKYDLKNEEGIFYLTPVNTLTQNGAIELTGEIKELKYLSGGVPMVFMITGETKSGSFITKEALLEIRNPRLEYSITKRNLSFKVYNTRHFYLSGGIGRVEAKENAKPYFSGGDFYFEIDYSLPPYFTVPNNLLKAICLPVIHDEDEGKATLPYCIEIKI